MPASLAHALYSLMLRALSPVYVLRLLLRGREEPSYRKRIRERFGIYRRKLPRSSQARPHVWLHAVSMGETRAAKPLIQALRERVPGMRLVLTCSTATGVEAGRELLHEGDVQTWLPFDTPGATRRFMKRFAPAVGVIMETEVWPNLLHEAKRAQVPMVLANARLSQRSLERGRRFDAVIRPAVATFARVLAQSIPDAQRLREAGAKPVEVCGNLKFDISPPPKMLALGLGWRTSHRRETLLLASSREGEEPMLLDAWMRLPAPRPLLLIVPRHPQRFGDVAGMVRTRGLRFARRSQWGDRPQQQDLDVDVWLGDSMGEMPIYYASADVCMLGGSFAEFGGQNLIEAAACGCPIVMGPHTFNFAAASELALQSRAAIRVDDMVQGVERAVALARDPQRNEWVERAFNFAAMHRGATERMVERVLEVAKVKAVDVDDDGESDDSPVADSSAASSMPLS
jgi:3-deoxy-D-manno-octulosonic-acid transferase